MRGKFKIILSYIIPVAILVTSCNSGIENKETAIPVSSRISAETQKSSSPYLLKDHQGNLVLAWVQAVDTTNNFLLTYAVSRDGGNTFEAPTTIPTTAGVYPHEENLSKILFKENGDIMAMFAVSNPNPENSYAGLVKYTQSFDGGKTWTDPRLLAENAANSIDERYFDMTLLPNGEIAAIWLDSRKDTDKEGSSLHFASTSGRNGFKDEKVIDWQLCQCCRTDLYVDEQGALHAAYRAILNDSIRDMMYMVSTDNGKTFSKRERISADNWAIKGCPHTGPAMTSNSEGIHFAWYTMGGGNGVYYSYKQAGKLFTVRETVSNLPSAKHPQITTFNNGSLAIVWDEKSTQTSISTNRIGLQYRDKKGNFLSNSYLTPDTISASYPVILETGSNNLLVAYTIKSDNKSEVWYQLVPIKK